jgi:hypothetical protein
LHDQLARHRHPISPMHRQALASLLTDQNPFLALAPDRPPRPARAMRKERPIPPFAAIRRRLRHVAVRAIDRGWFGSIPLEAHLVICGFPRSGTTLLHLMVQTAIPDSRYFLRERSGFGTARRHWPGRERYLITKEPDDIFWIDEIRAFYELLGTRTRTRFVICVRDPRAVLTSRHESNTADYWVSIDRWRWIYDQYRYVKRFPDVCVVEFKDLIQRTAGVQDRLTTFVGWTPARDFAEFHRHVPEGFDTRALNGVRSVDLAALDRWRDPAHAARVRQLLREMPELPDRLIEMGYEVDDRWTSAYR